MLLKFLGKYRDAGLLIMRVGLGIMFMLHGLPDLIAGPKKWAVLGAAMGHLGIPFYPKLWGFLACATEGIGGLLLAIGINLSNFDQFVGEFNVDSFSPEEMAPQSIDDPADWFNQRA